MIVQINERALQALGFDATQIDMLRHFLRMVGTVTNTQTLPDTVMQVALQGSPQISAALAELRKEFDDSRIQVPNDAALAEMRKEIEALAHQVATLSTTAAELAELRKEVDDAKIMDIFPPQPADWEHPGKLGDKTPNTGALTVLNVDPSGLVGTDLLPALYLGIDKTTGFYRTAANEWAMTISGAQQIKYTITENLFKQNVKTEKQFISTIAVGTSPMVVTSTTKVANLHVERATLADTATVANSLGTASTYPANATDLPTVITLANAIKAANISKGV